MAEDTLRDAIKGKLTLDEIWRPLYGIPTPRDFGIELNRIMGQAGLELAPLGTKDALIRKAILQAAQEPE